MWIDLALQRIQARLQKKPLLLFQLNLDSGGIPDFDRNCHRRDRSGKDRHLNPKIRIVKIENIPGKSAPYDLPDELQHQNAYEEGNLPVVTRDREITTNPSIEAEVHHRRERPYVFAIRRQFPESARDVSGCNIHG